MKHTRTAFTGKGAAYEGGRWNPEGLAVVYTSSSIALAAMEYFVNLSSPRDAPRLVAIPAEIPNTVRIIELTEPELPSDWRASPVPQSTQQIGEEWLRAARSVALTVPSALIPGERNCLLNPAHRDFKKIRIGKPQSFSFDPRMWK